MNSRANVASPVVTGQPPATRTAFVLYVRQLQDHICQVLAHTDGAATFTEDRWQRPGGGGGRSRVLQNGSIFEKAGVNISEVEGLVTEVMREKLGIAGNHFFAAGISLVLHPHNPFVPTVHANLRYFELYDKAGNSADSWFGGGMDLTPFYLFEEDAFHFHSTLKNTCDEFDTALYPVFKKACDAYFVNKHRNNEARGIGGIFFDHLRNSNTQAPGYWLQFCQSCGNSFVPAYLPVVEKRKNTLFNEKHKHWQEIRRGRYVEFNLVHDRGTLFGLQTNGRTESILMSLPPVARFEYDHSPAPGSEEEKLNKILLSPREWV